MAKLRWDKNQNHNSIKRNGSEFATKEFFGPRGNQIHCKICFRKVTDIKISEHINEYHKKVDESIFDSPKVLNESEVPSWVFRKLQEKKERIKSHKEFASTKKAVNPEESQKMNRLSITTQTFKNVLENEEKKSDSVNTKIIKLK